MPTGTPTTVAVASRPGQLNAGARRALSASAQLSRQETGPSASERPKQSSKAGTNAGARSGQLVAHVRSASAIQPRERDQMWALFQEYYADVTRVQFEQDLNEKDDVILLRDTGDDSVAGFSTIQVYKRKIGRKPVVAVFSGDTIVDQEYWGQTALQRAFGSYILRQKFEHPSVPVYWFLITKGYKTYLLLQRNFPEHWPRYEMKTPAWQQELLDTLSRDKFGSAYVAELGLLRFPEAHGRLRPDVTPVCETSLKDPAIRFFTEKNPAAAEGEELVCIGRVDLAFCLKFARKFAGKQLRRTLGLRRAA